MTRPEVAPANTPAPEPSIAPTTGTLEALNSVAVADQLPAEAGTALNAEHAKALKIAERSSKHRLSRIPNIMLRQAASGPLYYALDGHRSIAQGFRSAVTRSSCAVVCPVAVTADLDGFGDATATEA